MRTNIARARPLRQCEKAVFDNLAESVMSDAMLNSISNNTKVLIESHQQIQKSY